MICLGSSDEESENSLLRLLDVLLTSDKKASEKKEILENDFQIPMTEKLEAEVEYMCNLSDGVEQKGIQKGIEIGIEQGIETALYGLVRDNLLTAEVAAKRLDMTVEEFQIKMEKFA